MSRRLRLCCHDDGVISQFSGFERLKPFNSAEFTRANPNGRIDWTLEKRGDTVDAYQVTRQADVLMLCYLVGPDELIAVVRSMGYAMDRAQLGRTVRYYLDRVSHESSLSRAICAGALAWLDLDESWRFFERGLCIDLDSANSASAEEGLHLGAMASSLDVLQRHYLGLHTRGETLVLAPALPSELGPVRLRLQHRGVLLTLASDGRQIRLVVDPGGNAELAVEHKGCCHRLAPGATLVIEPPGHEP